MSFDFRRLLAAGIALILAIGSCILAVLAGQLLVAVLAAGAGIGAIATAVAGKGRRLPDNSGVVDRAVEQAQAGRRLAFYDRETGFFAHWYLTLRCEEEAYRAERYSRPLTVVVVEPSAWADSWLLHGQLTDWLRRNLRASDIVGYLGNARFVVLMPEAERAAVDGVVARLRTDLEGVEAGVSRFPDDGRDCEQLVAAAAAQLGEQTTAVA